MRKFVIMSITVILIVQFIFSACASSATTRSFVDDNLLVTYNFAGFDASTYNQTKNNAQFNASTIPEIIVNSMTEKNLIRVSWGPAPQPIAYDDANRTIDVSFFLSGSDIISFSINRTSINRTYKVKSEWQKFQVNLTSNLTVDFAAAFDKAVSEWQRISYTDASQNVHPAFYYKNNQTSTVDVSFYLVLPSSASSVGVEGDIVTYQMPALFADQLLSSPLLILVALIIVLAIVLLYRKAR
jgi:hypothetical protein